MNYSINNNNSSNSNNESKHHHSSTAFVRFVKLYAAPFIVRCGGVWQSSAMTYLDVPCAGEYVDKAGVLDPFLGVSE